VDPRLVNDGPVQPHNSSGPEEVGKEINPCDIAGFSSPDFEVGESTIKRRRIKKKRRNHKIDSQPIQHQFCPSERDMSSSSIDLNKECDIVNDSTPDKASSPTHSLNSASSSSREFILTAEIGRQVGFQIGRDDPAIFGAINGGGAKTYCQ